MTARPASAPQKVWSKVGIWYGAKLLVERGIGEKGQREYPEGGPRDPKGISAPQRMGVG